MPRIRSIKPEITADRKFTQISRDARLTFIYTWTVADDDGLFRAEPRQLLGQLYPHDTDVTDKKLGQWLDELVENGIIQWRRTRDGCRVGQIVNWPKHQKITNKSISFLLHELVEPNEDLEIISTPSLGSTEDVEECCARSLEPRAQSLESITVVLDHYSETHPRRKVGDSGQKNTAKKALNLGFSVEDLCHAITGNARDTWHKERRKHELGYVLRNSDKINEFIAKYEDQETPVDPDNLP